MKKQSLLEQVAKNLPKNMRTLNWEQKVKPEHQSALAEIRAAWLEGEFGHSIYPAARAIAKTLNESGISDVRHSGVLRWLRGD